MSNLLVRAEADIKIAKLLISPEGNPSNDEMITEYEELKGRILDDTEKKTGDAADIE